MKRSQYFRAACQWNEMESRRVLQCSRADRLLFLKWNIRSSISSPYAKAPGQVVSIHCFQLCIEKQHAFWFAGFTLGFFSFKTTSTQLCIANCQCFRFHTFTQCTFSIYFFFSLLFLYVFLSLSLFRCTWSCSRLAGIFN